MRLKSIQFRNHKILGDLFVNFCDSKGKPVDTVIIAGENGTGKSTLLNEIYKIVTFKVNSPMEIKLINDTKQYNIEYLTERSDDYKDCFINATGIGKNILQISSLFKSPCNFFCGIYSDVDITFNSGPISTVTSLDVDVNNNSRRSDEKITKETQQLLIDIQNLDDARLSKYVRDAKGQILTINEQLTNGRMTRFLNAFNYMFDDLAYDRIENISGQKRIIFKRGENIIYLDNLSSGEKQIIYRGSFLLQDINALEGALVLIDEPEISMHPEWQKKIMEFYKRIFTNYEGVQTSQIFAVTHSPFIIHNELRENDKVIVLVRNKTGEISVLDKPEYYICESRQAVKDAFQQDWYTPNDNTVYLEGRTDEKYFEKAIKVFKYQDLPFKFKWIGHINSKDQEEFTGKDSLSKAYQFSISAQQKFKQVFLFDCDTNRMEEENELSYIRVIPQYDNKIFKIGIENALVIDDIVRDNLIRFYSSKETIDYYGAKKIISEFKKMEFCDYVCSLKDILLVKILVNLDTTINKLIKVFEQ